ncbi:hypothetical protein PQ465_16215 [Sphingobacterium oryzagri]|uniref:Transmembrane protein n=1 Tax=Sphingobacterium oryzagri TaxID=3025669 RepID=A0ABY7WDV2_9SPHI|nr:hypothetical protein [Sphingobacterium sp. KACC 22765]WDF67833.1 hypothetical protein PQ465_16215 [Sphingobacterium sp. KACC 22765]
MSYLTLTLTGLIMAAIAYYAKKKANTTAVLANGDKVLKCHIAFGILGYFCGLLLLFFLGLGFYFGWESGENDGLASNIFIFITFLAIVYGFIYLLFYHRNHRVVFNEHSVEVFDAWGRSTCVSWDSIANAEVHTGMNEIRLYTEDGTRIKMSTMLYGLDTFRAEMYKHKPYLVQRTIAP